MLRIPHCGRTERFHRLSVPGIAEICPTRKPVGQDFYQFQGAESLQNIKNFRNKLRKLQGFYVETFVTYKKECVIFYMKARL